MVQVIRRVVIAIGSFVIASLVMSLVGLVGSLLSVGLPFDWLAYGSAFTGIVTFVLGALIYEDIVRRERPAAVSPGG